MTGETAAQPVGKTIRLPGGPSIGYDEYGTPDGPAVFVFHGNPGSRLDALYAGRTALNSLPVRLIAPDRPGIGLSDPQPHRLIADWPADVNHLADALGIERYAVIGGSTGGPYALACARLSPQRITAAGVISSLGPPEGPAETRPVGTAGMYFKLARRLPPLLRAQLWLMAKGLNDPARMVREATKAMPAPDRALLAEPEAQQALLASLAEGLRTPGGLAQDAGLATRPWGFALQEISLPVHIWHGAEDGNSPVAAARYLAQTIPNSLLRIWPDEGHFSMLRHLPEMVEEMTGMSRGRG